MSMNITKFFERKGDKKRNLRRKAVGDSFELSSEEEHILRIIGYFYHDKYAPDTNKAFIELRDLGIHKVIIEDVIYICLERPGLLIGVKGSNIEALEKYFIEHDINKKIHIIEVQRPPFYYLTSWQYMYMDWY